MARLVLIAAVLAGCSEKNETVRVPDQDTVFKQALGAVEVTDAMIASVEEIVGGDLSTLGTIPRPIQANAGPPSTAEPVYDESTGRWRILELHESPSGSVSSIIEIRYEDENGAPQRSPGATTRLVHFGVECYLRTSTIEDDDDYLAELQYRAEVEIGDLAGPRYDAHGVGLLTGGMVGEKNGREIDYEMGLAWVVDLEVPSTGGCASGSVAVTAAPYSLSASFSDNSSQYAWTFSRGETPLSGGTGDAACSRSPENGSIGPPFAGRALFSR